VALVVTDELWTVGERAAKRLVELGRAGIGGFVAAPRSADVMVTRRAGLSLDVWLDANPGPVAWQRALAMVASLAEAAQVCEKQSLFPGAITTDQLVVRDDALELRADPLVHAIAGKPAREAQPPTWLPPEAQRPDNASNRYAIGLVAYRLLTGEHPFAGRGLRLGLDDQAVRGAPPFAPGLAATLPPGLQSLVLGMLSPDPELRPASASAIASACRELVGRTRSAGASNASRALVDPDRPSLHRVNRIGGATRSGGDASRTSTEAAGGVSRSRRRLTAIVALVPIAAGGAIAVWAVGAAGSTTPRAPHVEPRAPLASARELADCASCHPRQAAEWSRSVMAHSVESPLFGSLEMLIEEQVGRDRRCPDGAGVLRAAGVDPCVEPRTNIALTGAGGEGWCINCHAPGENLAQTVPAWNAHGDARDRRPLRDVLSRASMEGISCAACHQMTSPVHPGTRYQGNATWTSTETGAVFGQRPEDERGVFGIGNSGYLIDPRALISAGPLVAGGAHRRLDDAARAYRHASEFCGACHDVRLFGTDAISGEHFKRLRNAYSEWAAWASDERRAGRQPASCQDCHMSLYPAICVASPGAAAAGGCPAGTQVERRAPGTMPSGRAAAGSALASISTHYFSGVDVPLSRLFDPAAVDDHTVDVSGIPVGARARRDLLLASAMTLVIDTPRRDGDHLEVPIVVDNVGAGHRVPAGFSQEREIWVHLRITDARGRLVYEAGRVDRPDDDLRDKRLLRVTTRDPAHDRFGRPLGMFGADIADGPDVPRWTAFGDAAFRGRGLVNFQNGFLRCVSCIGTIDAHGQCQAAPGQGAHRADRYIDGFYDQDTGECRSNLHGKAALLETYFPVGALDASRGLLKGPDAIIDTRSLAPNRPARYIYDLDAPGTVGPYTVEATLEFRAFPPYLIRAFIDYEAAQARAGLRPSGPLVDRAALDRLDIVDVATTRAVIP
jgi:hypothetical protein